MKPWLLNVLACPIDKHHPLEPYFFTWENEDDELEKIQREAGKPNKIFSKQYKHLVNQIIDKTISPLSLLSITDKTQNLSTYKLLVNVQEFSKKLDSGILNKNELLHYYIEDVDILYKYLNLIEVEEGILFCTECRRWYPIGSAVKTIPELLPDNLREKERDLEWMENWKTKILKKIIENGKPYTIS